MNIETILIGCALNALQQQTYMTQQVMCRENKMDGETRGDMGYTMKVAN